MGCNFPPVPLSFESCCCSTYFKRFLIFHYKKKKSYLLKFFHWSWLCSRILLVWIQDTPERTVSDYSEEHTVHADCQLQTAGLSEGPVLVSALEPRELKVWKLLEQNQAYLPKLITPGSRSIIYWYQAVSYLQDRQSPCLILFAWFSLKNRQEAA